MTQTPPSSASAPRRAVLALAAAGLMLGACVTVRVKIDPIYAKIDADVRLRLDQDVKTLIQQNPNLF
jgi:hypothetical protein